MTTIKWEPNLDGGSIEVDKEDLDAAYREGGLTAVNELAQELVDDWARNNLCAMADEFSSWEPDEGEDEDDE